MCEGRSIVRKEARKDVLPKEGSWGGRVFMSEEARRRMVLTNAHQHNGEGRSGDSGGAVVFNVG
jgi:hypothetical protein